MTSHINSTYNSDLNYKEKNMSNELSSSKKPVTTQETAKHQDKVAAKHYADPAFRARWEAVEAPHPMDSVEEWNKQQWELWRAAQVRHSGSYTTGSFAGKNLHSGSK